MYTFQGGGHYIQVKKHRAQTHDQTQKLHKHYNKQHEVKSTNLYVNIYTLLIKNSNSKAFVFHPEN